MSKFQNGLYTLILVLFLPGCFPQQAMDNGLQTLDVEITPPPTVTAAPPATLTAVPTTSVESSPTVEPQVTITAVKGNLYIRRGPGLPYNQIGVLYKGASARIIGQDVLARWVQIQIPNSEHTGWVSVMSDFTRVDGDLDGVPNFTYTEWPLPAYVKNCTEHDLVLEPGDIYLFSLWTNAQYLNEVQVDPGVYTAYDLFVPGAPEVQKVDIKEGMTVYLTVNGLGVRHKCP